MARTTPIVEPNEDDSEKFDGTCPICGFKSVRHDKKNSARDRIVEHLKEHEEDDS